MAKCSLCGDTIVKDEFEDPSDAAIGICAHCFDEGMGMGVPGFLDDIDDDIDNDDLDEEYDQDDDDLDEDEDYDDDDQDEDDDEF